MMQRFETFIQMHIAPLHHGVAIDSDDGADAVAVLACDVVRLQGHFPFPMCELKSINGACASSKPHCHPHTIQPSSGGAWRAWHFAFRGYGHSECGMSH